MARSFPIQWTTTWTGELAKTCKNIGWNPAPKDTFDLPWYPIKCTVWTWFTLFYPVLLLTIPGFYPSTASLKWLPVGDVAQLQNPVQCRPAQCQTSVLILYGPRHWWSNFSPLSNQRISPLGLCLCHHRSSIDEPRNKSPGKADFGWTFTSM